MAGLGVAQAPRESAANDGDNVRVGVNNTGTSTTVIAATAVGNAGLRVTNGTSGGDASADAIQGYATGDSNAGIFGRNDANKGVGVYGTAPSGTGVFGESSAGFGVAGKSTSGQGVRGESSTGTAVYGESISGNTIGVHGKSVNLYGVRGEATSNGVGVYGTANSYGVLGQAALFGVYGQASSGFGVTGYGSTSAAAGLYGLAAAGGLAGRFDGPVVVYGNFSVSGTKAAIVPGADGQSRRLYCQESPEPWFEDFGGGQLTAGRAQVLLDADFAAVVKTDAYRVFVVPEGDCKGLYVTAKTPTGFEVRELQGGTSTIPFSYRVVARRKDIPGPRLEKVDLRPPSPPDFPPPAIPTSTAP
jgi:hypothetical protein